MILIHFCPLRRLSILHTLLLFRNFAHGLRASSCDPFVVQRLQVPVQVLIYAGLFVCAEYLVNWLHLPAAGEPGRYVDAAGADYLSGYPAELGAGRRALAVGGNAAVFVPAVVAVVNYTQLLMVDGWRIFLVIALSTLMVLGRRHGWWIKCIVMKSAG